MALASRSVLCSGAVDGFQPPFGLSSAKAAEELCPGDCIIYCSPGEVWQGELRQEALTATGRVTGLPSEARARIVEVEMRADGEVSLMPLLSQLSFGASEAWRHELLRQGIMRLLPGDYRTISEAMRLNES